jgi:hypothetical protein
MTLGKRAKQQNQISAAKPQQAGTKVNPRDTAGDIPAIKFDDVGAITLLATGANYVLCGRKGAYPMIRTVKEWRALSDTAVVHAAARAETFHRNNSSVLDQSKTERS